MYSKEIADKKALLAVKQIQVAVKDPKRLTRLKNTAKNALAYENDTTPAPAGEFSFPGLVYSGFEDTLVSKLNDPIRIIFAKQEEADLKKAKKVTGAAEFYSQPVRGAWEMKDIMGKKAAARGGFAIFEKHSEQREINGKDVFVDVLRNVKAEDFYCQRGKGWDLETHDFLGEFNITRTKSELENGVKAGLYDAGQVDQLIAAYGKDSGHKFNEFLLNSSGKDPMRYLDASDADNQTGEPTYSLVGHLMQSEGERSYLLLDYRSGIWVRAENLEEILEKPADAVVPLWNYKAWHTHPEADNFWTKAPGDDVRPVHEMVKVLVNLSMLNLKKRIKAKRAIDPNFFPDAREIADSVTEVVEANSIPGRSMGEGVYEFKTDDNTSIMVNLVNFVNNFLGEKTGITPGAQGAARESTATVYVGNIEQVANRMNLYSKFYQHCWAQIGLLFFLGLKKSMTEEMYVRVMGTNGYEWDELKEADVNPMRDYDIRIQGGAEDAQNTAVTKKAKSEALEAVAAKFPQVVNPREYAEQRLRAGDWDDEEIKLILDTDVYGSREILAEAAQAIQDICAGAEPKINRKANEAFVMKIIDYADDTEDLEPNKQELLYAYASLHMDVVAKNAARRAIMMASMAGQIPGAPVGALPQQPAAPQTAFPSGVNPQQNPGLAANAATLPPAPTGR